MTFRVTRTVCDLQIVTILLFLAVLKLLLPLELFLYLHQIIGILSFCISAHLTVLLLLNPVLKSQLFSSAYHV